MKISSQKKKEILINSFETLKNNYTDNDCNLWEIIGKISKLDLPLALEMWKCLIIKYPAVNHSTNDFAFSIMYEIENNTSPALLYEVVIKDEFLKNAIFYESGDLSHCPLNMIEYFITKNNLSIANELLELCLSNKNRKNSLFDILNGVIPRSNVTLTESAFDLLSEWVKKVKNKEQRTKLNLKLLEFFECDDEENDDN